MSAYQEAVAEVTEAADAYWDALLNHKDLVPATERYVAAYEALERAQIEEEQGSA